MANVNISIPPNYSYIFPFENEFNYKRAHGWMAKNWTQSFYYVAVYLLVIFSAKFLLRNHKSFQLRGWLIAWNALLAIFSFIGACRTTPELLHVLGHYGLVNAVCVPSNIVTDKVASLWTWLFVLSKVPELGDTVFVVLRKQPLNFLHYYHHSTVLIYTWFTYSEIFPARWFVVMNYNVHSIMYTYYALKAARVKVPRFIAMAITALQLVQMVIGCFINIKMMQYRRIYGTTTCNVSNSVINGALAIYFSYFLLFARFFYMSYIANDGPKSPPKLSVHQSNQVKQKVN